MKAKTQGAWIVHHSKKLSNVSFPTEFEDIELAGKCGTFLANLAASDEQTDLNQEKVAASAKVSNIKKSELDAVKKILKDAHLIDTTTSGGISVLGVTTSSILDHTASIFNGFNPDSYQKAAIQIAESISNSPVPESLLKEQVSDEFKLLKRDTDELLNQAEDFGFIDHEKLSGEEKYYFNGNLFRRDTIQKTKAVLGSLNASDNKKILEVDGILSTSGCIPDNKAKQILGETLFNKLIAIGMYDQNEVSNVADVQILITKPAAFSKFGDPFEVDALDMAKAFVAALYYGINFSSYGRGNIRYLKALVTKLINGHEVGPATAIGEDYSLLELRRVIKLRRDGTSSMYYMRLLKKDIGKLALSVLETGSSSEQVVLTSQDYKGATAYRGPEETRYAIRKNQGVQSKRSIGELLRTFRS